MVFKKWKKKKNGNGRNFTDYNINDFSLTLIKMMKKKKKSIRKKKK